MTPQDFNRREDDALSAAARSLHEEWESPDLWPRIAAHMREEDGPQDARRVVVRPSRWHLPSPAGWRLAAAAVVLIALSSTTWIVWRNVATPDQSSRVVSPAEEQLLTDEAVAEIERSEAQYVHAIEELTRLAKPKLDMPSSPLVISLRERLMTIDVAIDEYRMEIDRNRFNAHLRQQLLWIYQEKRRTLEAVQE